MLIEKGMVFDTVAEKGCHALATPDEDGVFLAVDSQSVECEFSTDMVQNARRPGYLVAARAEIDGADLSITDQVAVTFFPALEAVKELDPQPSEMFAVWEAGEVEPSAELAEHLTQGLLPQYVYVYAGGRLWLLDEMYVGVTKSAGRG
ncbi:hypothetical protein ACLGIH_19800 [Streptomyces sp. HMX87]|uniref:hypothetical protein n=1 Tax=Streptomyces sp. HMX87 TaxID=3390849 RepID=UPI003A8B265F